MRHLNPADDKHPGTACNSPSPRAQSAAPVRCGARRTVNRPPADQPPRQITLHLQRRSASLARASRRGDCGPRRKSRPRLPAARPPEPSGMRLRLTGDVRAGRSLPFPAFSPRSRTTPLAHIAGRAPESLILSLSWDLLRKFVNGKEAAKVADILRSYQPLRRLLHSILRDIGRRLVIFIRDSRTVITALIAAIGPRCRCWPA